MKTEFNPLEALADISEDELNEFIELQEEAPKKRRRQKPRESGRVPGIKNRGIKKCKAKDNQIIIHFSSVPLF